MQKILTSSQIKQADRFTIENEPVSSLELMERATAECLRWVIQNIGIHKHVLIFCGPGNNGGDGLALARMLHKEGFGVQAVLCNDNNAFSEDNLANQKRLQSIDNKLFIQESRQDISDLITPESLVIDAIFGVGLSKQVSGKYGAIIQKINSSKARVVSIDLPSGIYSDKSSLLTGNEIIKANHTLTFQYLKPAMMVAENEPFLGEVSVLNIGLIDEAIHTDDVQWLAPDIYSISSLYHPRPKFSHKGTFGSGLLVAGGSGTSGAAILAARAFLRSGAGLLTVAPHPTALEAVRITVPDAMTVLREMIHHPGFLSRFRGVGIGPGIGTDTDAITMVEELLNRAGGNLVLDADAINVISMRPELTEKIPENSILTPHPGEFKRLTGGWKNDFQKLELQQQFAVNRRVFVILKGHYTSVATPEGKIYFNTTGNSGMAKGGSGDILTGLITGLLCSGYTPFEACLTGVYLHGMAGDAAAADLTMEGMQASDLIKYLPEAWKKVISYHHH